MSRRPLPQPPLCALAGQAFATNRVMILWLIVTFGEAERTKLSACPRGLGGLDDAPYHRSMRISPDAVMTRR